MKKVLIPLLALLLSAPVFAGSIVDFFAGGGTDVSTDLNYFVAKPVAGAYPRLKYASVTADNAANILQFYSKTNTLTCSGATAASGDTVTNISASVTNVLQAGGVIVLHDTSEGAFQRVKVHAVEAGNSFVITNDSSAATTDFALAAGDQIYVMKANGSVPVGNSTVTIGPAEAVFIGDPGDLLLLEVDGSSACEVNAVGGDYYRP